jgi:hypothetical protein
MQGFLVVEALADIALKAFSKAFEVAGFDSLKARLPEGLRTVVVHTAALFRNKMVDLDCQRDDLMRFSSAGALMNPIRAQRFIGSVCAFPAVRDESIIGKDPNLAQRSPMSLFIFAV